MGQAMHPFLQFVNGVPPMEIKDGMLHVGPGPLGNTGVFPLAVVRKMHKEMARLIAEHDAKPDPVIPLCELCVRRNLPRLGSD
jgi:hypothetical protein